VTRRRIFPCCVLGLFLLMSMLGGCSSFDKNWNAFPAEHNDGIGVIGRWYGTWTSEASGHTGELRCIVTPKSDGAYLAEYHATFMGALSAGYETTFKPRYVGGRFQFEGTQDLGFMAGGVYTYDGEVDGDEYFANYRSKNDQGVYRMQRVKRRRQEQP